MLFKRRTAGLFWKLVLALWLSMGLSIAGGIAYLHLTGKNLPVDDLPKFGVVPLVPLVSGSLTILIVGLLLAWYLTRPLRHLRWALHRVAQGRFETRVHPLMGRRRDEIADLAHDFDRMAAQLQKLTESRTLLLHDISHELRSPLTRMQAAIGLLRQDASRTPAMIDRIERESLRLDALVEELLTLHRVEAEAPGAVRERVDVLELLHAIAEDADFEARAAKRSVSIDAPGRFICDVNGELIYRAFENVVRNALKFGPPGAVVEICARLESDGGALVTTVKDRGPGVPSDMLQAIFEPFTRVEGSDSVGGVGLGLAIAQRAMALHDGHIEAALREGGGLMVTLRLPAQSGASQAHSRQARSPAQFP